MTLKTQGAKNASPSPPRHVGAGMNIVPELALMEALVLGLHHLAEDVSRMEEAVQRVDALRFNDSEDWRNDMIEALREMVDPSSDNYLRVFIGYDEAVANMPAVHIENDGSSENTSEATAGNEIGRHYTIRNPVDPTDPLGSVDFLNPRGESDDDISAPPTPLQDHEHVAVRHLVTGVGMTSSMIVGCWHPAPERALLIQAAVRFALWEMRPALHAKGIHEFTWSESSIRPSPDMEPRLAYVPILTIQMSWTYRVTRTKVVPNRVRIGAGSFSA